MTTKTFDSLGLSTKTLKAVKKVNYSVPMPVQAEVIPLVLQGKDALVSAQTGSGKTAAFTIPLLEILDKQEDKRCLIVAPTRELAEQIHKVFTELCQSHDGIKSALIVGGKHIGDQLKKLKKNPRFIIGTPGRINDHIKRKSLDLSSAKYVVWDETDRMLDLGFIHQIEHIISKLPEDRQTLMFSATFPKRIVKLAEKYLKDPVRVEIDTVNTVSDNITQKKIDIEGDTKLKELSKLLGTLEGQILVFAKTQRQVEKIAKTLNAESHDAIPIHGGQRQSKRDNTMKSFRANDVRILIATDVAARGLDITDLAYVINFELPQSPEEYIHRIGRTGRAKAKGTAISLVAKADKSKWKEIQSFLKGKEEEQSEESLRKQNRILESNRKHGPFPVKKEERISFKNEKSGGKGRYSDKSSDKNASRKTFVKKKFGFKAESEKPERAERNERPSRSSNSERFERSERSARPSRSERFERRAVAEAPAKSHKAKRDERKGNYNKAMPAHLEVKTEDKGPFKKVFVGSSKKKYIKDKPKKYGNGPAKRWAKVKMKSSLSKNKFRGKRNKRR